MNCIICEHDTSFKVLNDISFLPPLCVQPVLPCAVSVQTVVTVDPPESGGGRSYVFWLLVAVVLLVAVFNMLITLTLISVLRISVGMESVQVRPAGDPAVGDG